MTYHANDSYCLVLSGGGAKGIYHVGVWKALTELGVQVDAFIGNSIGAIIAAFLAQGLDETVFRIAAKIGLDYILNIPPNLIENGELRLNLGNRESFRQFYHSILNGAGLDTAPLRNLLDRHIDEQVIRKRDVDFGLVTFNVTKMKPEEVFIDAMENGELVNYVMASSAFPGFNRPEIGGSRYIDGGVYDNIPFAMAKSRGYRSIIVSDISGIGVRRRPEIDGTRTIYIKNSIEMGGVLDFDRSFLDRFSLLGYLDTMRVFEKLEGGRYFLLPDSKVNDKVDGFLSSSKFTPSVLVDAGKETASEKVGFTLSSYRSLLPKNRRHAKRCLPVFADCAAHILSLERIQSWTYSELFEQIVKKSREIRQAVAELEGKGLRETERSIRKAIREQKLRRTPFFYRLLAEEHLGPRLSRLLGALLKDLVPEIPAGVFFIDLLDSYLSE